MKTLREWIVEQIQKLEEDGSNEGMLKMYREQLSRIDAKIRAIQEGEQEEEVLYFGTIVRKRKEKG
jgi:hypothetical protein